jgi:hypothetical protein
VRRTLIVTNILLLVLIAASVWLIARRNRNAHAEQRVVLNRKPRVPVASKPVSQMMPAPASPQTYFNDTVQKVLLAKDRNPNVVEKATTPPPEPPIPPMPAAYGVLTFGEPTLILSAKPGDAQHAYRKGDMVGPFKLADFDGDRVVLEWNGKSLEKQMAELAANQVKAPMPQVPEPAATPSAPAQQQQSRPEPSKAGPGADLGAGERACQADDQSPPGTEVDGYKKVVTNTPFGAICRWVK